MVLGFTPDTGDLETLAQLTDKIAEVAAPSISAVNTSQLTEELEQLRAGVTSLKGIITSFPQPTVPRRDHPRGQSETTPEAAQPAPTF